MEKLIVILLYYLNRVKLQLKLKQTKKWI